MERRFIKGALLSAHPEVGSLRAAHRSKNRDGWGNHSMEESRRGPASRGRIIEEVLPSDCWSSFCRSSGMEHAVDRLKADGTLQAFWAAFVFLVGLKKLGE